MTKPTATIYQNETEVIIIFSPAFDLKSRIYRGASVSFENHWQDGGASGLSGFESKKELNKFLKSNKLVKKGTLILDDYCGSKHENTDGSIFTCVFKPKHYGKHKARGKSWK